MKRIFLFFVILSMILNSCDNFKSKDELLTKDTWIVYLSHNDTLNKSIGKNTKLHKLKDNDIVFAFHKDGTASISDNGIPVVGDLKWEWKDDTKKSLNIIGGVHYGEYTVFDLNSKELTLFMLDMNTGISKTMTFHHPNGEWNDEIVDKINNSKK